LDQTVGTHKNDLISEKLSRFVKATFNTDQETG